MLPFRAVLEGMGAEVSYDDATRLVTASRGDTTIKFTLEDDTIYINSNGENSELKLDVPMIIKNNRTLVPIRFLSNALGMQIGWDGDYQTVLIVDAEAYAEDFEKNAPNLMALTEKTDIKYNTSSVDLSFDISSKPFDGPQAQASIAAKLDSVTVDGAASVNGTISADIAQLGISVAPVENADIEIITADGKLYIKTDLIEKLFNSEYSSPITDALKAAVTGDKWFCVDVNALIDKMFGDMMPDEMKDLYAKILSSDASSFENLSLPQIVASISTTEGDATLESAMQADMIIDAYKAIDKYITVTDNKIEIKMSEDDLVDILASMGFSEELSAEELRELTDMLTFDIYAVSEYGETEASSRADITFGVKFIDEDTLTLHITETDKQDDNEKPAAAPDDAVDLMPFISGLMK